MPPVTLPYSPEFKPVDESSGPATLTTLAEATGGVSRDILGQIWSDLPKRPRFIEIAPWLLLAAILLLLTEILERRSGVLGARRRAVLREQRALARAEEGKEQPRSHEATKPRSRKKKARGDQPIKQPADESAEPAQPESPPEPAKPALALGDALKAARRAAKDRTRRGQ